MAQGAWLEKFEIQEDIQEDRIEMNTMGSGWERQEFDDLGEWPWPCVVRAPANGLKL